MAARGRKAGFKMPEEHRDKIRNSNILSALIEHAIGEREMSATQVQAGLGLLRKVLPDLQATQITGEVSHNYVARLPQPAETTDEWRKQHAPTTH